MGWGGGRQGEETTTYVHTGCDLIVLQSHDRLPNTHFASPFKQLQCYSLYCMSLLTWCDKMHYLLYWNINRDGS